MEVPHRSIRYQKLDLAVVKLQAKQARKGALNERDAAKLEELLRKREKESTEPITFDSMCHEFNDFFWPFLKILGVLFACYIVVVVVLLILGF